MLRILRVFLVFGIVLVAATALGATPTQRPHLAGVTRDARDTSEVFPINDVYVIHFILDGTNYETMQRAIRTGKLPTVKRVFVNSGAVFTEAISTFPSTSTSAYQSFITGLLPGHAGIPHLQRFDRQHEEFIDYLSVSGYLKLGDDVINLDALQNPSSADLDDTNTIFELLNGHPTLALYTTARRGAAEAIPAHIPLRGLWAAGVSHDYLRIDQLAYDKLFKKYGGKLVEVPRYSLVGLYSSDVSGHHEGAYSDAVITALEQFDYFLKDFLNLLDEQGIRDKTYIIVSADHGMHNTGNLFLFREALIKKDVAVISRDPRVKNYNVVPADRGISSTHVYTRRPDGTFAPLERTYELTRFPLKDGRSANLIEIMATMEPTELVIVRDGDDSTLVYNSEGNASRIECTLMNADQWCSYEIMSGNDPLKFTGRKARRLMDGKPHSSQEWKHATAEEYYMDAIVQLGTIFQDGRAGDIFVVPKEAWGLRVIKDATHGSLIQDDMHTPMFIAGPGVPRGSFGAMRTVDIYPLMLEWFNFDVPVANYDGVNPFEKYKGENKLWQRLATIEQNCSDRRCVRRHAVNRRAELRKLAVMELRDRQLLAAKLAEYIAGLEAQKDDKNSPQIALPDYVDDHLAIARMIQFKTKTRRETMEMIAGAL